MVKAKNKSIPSAVLERAASVLRVIAHPHRLKMVELLAEKDLTVGELAEAVGIAPAACSQHLNLMRAHGVLDRARNGKSTYYTVVNPNAFAVLECIRKHAC